MMTFARHGAFWSNEKMERVAGDASFFLSLGPPGLDQRGLLPPSPYPSPLKGEGA